jgi:hypothetical protein
VDASFAMLALLLGLTGVIGVAVHGGCDMGLTLGRAR